MFIEIVQGLTSAASLYEKRNTIAEIFHRVTHQVLYGTARIGVFGAGGVGKSTLGVWLKGNLDTDKSVNGYVETLETEEFKMAGQVPALLTVVPGQLSRRESSWNDLYRELAAGKSFRVVNVVSWGYHASGLERSRHRANARAATDQGFRQAYFDDSRNEELDAMDALVPHLQSAPGKLKMVTLVTKQDLWWNDRVDVEQFYKTGRYARAIDQVAKSKGTANFSHEYLSCALVEQNLRMADGFVLAQTTGGYDDPLRLQNLHNVAAALERFAKP